MWKADDYECIIFMYEAEKEEIKVWGEMREQNKCMWNSMKNDLIEH